MAAQEPTVIPTEENKNGDEMADKSSPTPDVAPTPVATNAPDENVQIEAPPAEGSVVEAVVSPILSQTKQADI